jgi:hypothetical protein
MVRLSKSYSIMKFFVEVLVAVSCIGIAHGFYYSTTNLESYCGSTLQLGCPYSYVDTYKRAGTLRFWNLPTSNCTVSVMIARYCSNTAAMYFNIKKSVLPVNATIEIYENVTYSTAGSLVKVISGGTQQSHVNPTSVSQLLSSYNSAPLFTIKLTTDGSRNSSYEVIFDFVTLLKTSSSAQTYCSALGGYILTDAMDCNTADDRVTCPYSYHTSVYANPATALQGCALSDGAIAGITVGTVVGVVLIITIFSLLCRNNRSSVSQYSSFGNNRPTVVIGSPVIIGGPRPTGQVSSWQVPAGAPSYAGYSVDLPPPYPANESVPPTNHKAAGCQP